MGSRGGNDGACVRHSCRRLVTSSRSLCVLHWCEVNLCLGHFLFALLMCMCVCVCVCMCLSSRGIFYQGYYCSRCGTGAHKECLEVITICKISRCFLQALSRKILVYSGSGWGGQYVWIKSLTTVVWQTHSTSSVVWALKYSCKKPSAVNLSSFIAVLLAGHFIQQENGGWALWDVSVGLELERKTTTWVSEGILRPSLYTGSLFSRYSADHQGSMSNVRSMHRGMKSWHGLPINKSKKTSIETVISSINANVFETSWRGLSSIFFRRH